MDFKSTMSELFDAGEGNEDVESGDAGGPGGGEGVQGAISSETGSDAGGAVGDEAGGGVSRLRHRQDDGAADVDQRPDAAREGGASGARARDGKGRFTKGAAPTAKQGANAGDYVGGQRAAPAKPTAQAQQAEPATQQTHTDSVAAQPPEEQKQQAADTQALRAPTSWSPAAREHWAKLPPAVQKEALRREKDVESALRESNASREFTKAFQQVLAPFEGDIRAAGMDPLRVFGGLLQTERALRTSAPAVRAQVVAGLVRDYGVDVGLLDQALAGGAQAQANGQAQHIDPATIAAQVEQRIRQSIQQQQTQTAAQGAQRDIEDFRNSGKAEFFDDVRNSMGIVLADAYERGDRTMTLEVAYARACQMHPEVSEVLRQREAVKQAANAQASTQRARAAAISVKSEPAGLAAPKAKDFRSTMAEVAAQLERGG